MMYKIYLCINFLQLIYLSKSDIADLRTQHQPKSLTDNQVRTLAGLTNTSDLQKHFDNIAVERIVGTQSHQKVKEYIIDVLTNLNWDVERHSFMENTPIFGKLKFENIIGTSNPNAYRFLVLACHYDSKYMKNEVFIGATDSAVPCAMMLNLIQVMKPYLEQLRNSNDLSLKLVFFDGEEAFRTWGPNDSIYGARELAKKLSSNHFKTNLGRVVTELARWDVLVLLDLLGAPDPKFYSLVQSGQKWYLNFVRAEQKLSDLDLLARYSNGKLEQTYFNPRSTQSYVEDDHVPFMKRGVPIVHLIPLPFPDVWHTVNDNMDIVDVNTVENLNKILRVFVATYLHLKI